MNKTPAFPLSVNTTLAEQIETLIRNSDDLSFSFDLIMGRFVAYVSTSRWENVRLVVDVFPWSTFVYFDGASLDDLTRKEKRRIVKLCKSEHKKAKLASEQKKERNTQQKLHEALVFVTGVDKRDE